MGNGDFDPRRLQRVREMLGINRAEAARRLQLSKMGYNRYENGQRTPSHQMIEFMAQRLNTNWAYLTGLSDDSDPDCLFISRESDPLLFDLVQMVQNADSTEKARLLHYLKSFR